MVLHELAQRLGEVGVLGRHRREQERVLAAVVTVERGAEAVAEEQQVLARGRRTPRRHLVQRHAVGGTQPVVDLAHLPAPGHQPGVLLLAHVAPTLAPTSSGPDPARGPGGRPSTGSAQVEPVELHDLGPRGDEVAHELLAASSLA